MISPTHVHLLINHLPVFGSIMGALVLLYGIWKQSTHTKNAAYLVLVIAALGAVTAYLTGEPAEETVENLQGVSKEMLETHEDAALFALIAFIITGLISLVGLYINQKKPSMAKGYGYLALVVALFSFSVVARTAYVGGQIRHSEIRGDTTELPGTYIEEEEDE